MAWCSVKAQWKPYLYLLNVSVIEHPDSSAPLKPRPPCLIPPCSIRILPSQTLFLITNYLSVWSRVVLEKLIVTHFVKKFPAFMKPEGLLPYSQGSATGLCGPRLVSVLSQCPTSLTSIITTYLALSLQLYSPSNQSPVAQIRYSSSPSGGLHD